MKIGFIAMSGIRTCDEELRRLGLTLPGFVERSKVIANLPSLGLLTLAGMTPNMHRREYVEVPDINELSSLPGDWDLVAISSYSAQIDEAYELASRYQKAGVGVVMGGLHVSCRPEEAAKYCDSVVIGQGEPVWPQILKDFEKGSLKQFYGLLEQEYDLADAPLPAFELLDMSKYHRLTVQASRGCPHQCEFCGSSPLIAKKYVQKPIPKVLAEIDKIKSLWNGRFIEFVDDNAVIGRTYWKELLPQLKRKKIRWFVETDISVAQDSELLTLMRKSGCAQVLIGLEAPKEKPLENLEIRSNWKYRQFPVYQDAVRTIQSHGIRVTGCFVLGLDRQDSENFDNILSFARQTEIFDVQITLLTPFVGTPLYNRFREQGRLLEPFNWKKSTLFDINFRPEHMSVEELRNGFRDLGLQIYNEESTKWRKEKFKQQLKDLMRREGSL